MAAYGKSVLRSLRHVKQTKEGFWKATEEPLIEPP